MKRLLSLLAPVVVASVVASACRATHERTVDTITIEAETSALADRTASAVERVLARFPVPREWPMTLTILLGDPDYFHGHAFTRSAKLLVDPVYDVLEKPCPRQLDFFVAHEMLHVYIRPHERQRLPALLEEGLVDQRAIVAVPWLRAWRRATHYLVFLSAFRANLNILDESDPERAPRAIGPIEGPNAVGVPSMHDAFAVTRSEFYYLTGAEKRLYTTIGWLLVERAGENVLQTLIERAAREDIDVVPPEWVFAAADMALDDPASWWPHVQSIAGREEIRELDAMAEAQYLFVP